MAARLRDNGEMESECWLKMKCPRQSLSIVTEDHILTDDSHHEGKITFPVCACNHLYCIILIVNAEGLFFMKYCVKSWRRKSTLLVSQPLHCACPLKLTIFSFPGLHVSLDSAKCCLSSPYSFRHLWSDRKHTILHSCHGYIGYWHVIGYLLLYWL